MIMSFMPTNCVTQPFALSSASSSSRRSPLIVWMAAGLAAFSLALSGCHSTGGEDLAVPMDTEAKAQTLREGDTIRVSFPTTPSLDTQQTVRTDGRVTLPTIGELRVVGKTPQELEKDLVEKYKNELVSNEVVVSILASSYTVYVSGAVMAPGKVQTEKPITPLQAILQGGGFIQGRANMKEVVVIREVDGKTKRYLVDLQRILDGIPTEQFYLRPNDMVLVKEKFVWF